MKSSSLLGLILPAVAIAVPITGNDQTIQLQPGEFLLTKEGQQEIFNETRLLEFLKAEGIAREPPKIDEEWLKFTPPPEAANVTESSLSARQASCSLTTSFVTDRTERFLDWDVQMSPVVKGAGRNGIQFWVESGWSISNGVSVSAGLDLKFVKDRLGSTLGINYSKTWTSSTSTRYGTTVNRGEAGTWTTQPWTNRRYGRTFRGCPGSLTQTGTWMADSHEEGSYEGHRWVSGFITACIKRAPTRGGLTRCHGQGEFR